MLGHAGVGVETDLGREESILAHYCWAENATSGRQHKDVVIVGPCSINFFFYMCML